MQCHVKFPSEHPYAVYLLTFIWTVALLLGQCQGILKIYTDDTHIHFELEKRTMNHCNMPETLGQLPMRERMYD